MSTAFLSPIELRVQGFDALVKALGWVNAVRFIQAYEPSHLNYLMERDQILPDWDADEMLKRLQEVKP